MPRLEDKLDSYFHATHALPFEIGAKGVPLCTKPDGRYSLLTDLPLPVAVVSQAALAHNVDWMQRFATQSHVKLCPHGKTTMSPQIFKMQIERGAWGLTVANPAQAHVAAQVGAKRIIIANQVVGHANQNAVIDLIEQWSIEVITCVDSQALIEQWQRSAQQRNISVPLLVELGVPGGRCGCRTHEQASELAQSIAQAPHLRFAGIEFYEGVIHAESPDDDPQPLVREFVRGAVALAESLVDLSSFDKPIVTGAGSAWYDVVAEEFANTARLTPVIRPGCYVIHDQGIYLEAQDQVMKRAQQNRGEACRVGGDLISALELYAYVLSVPEQNKAVIGLGKRDAAFDAGLPSAVRLYRDNGEIALPQLTSTAIMDQHLFVEFDPSHPLHVGDILAFSTSHPCLTFDKWRYIGVKTDSSEYVTKWLDTYF